MELAVLDLEIGVQTFTFDVHTLNPRHQPLGSFGIAKAEGKAFKHLPLFTDNLNYSLIEKTYISWST
jgi:hypothetical protein